MTPKLWQQVCKAFDRAVELSAEERGEFLEQLGRSEPEIRAEVAKLLHQREASKPAIKEDLPTHLLKELDDDTKSKVPHREQTDVPPENVGAYQIRGQLGQGGMGAVLLGNDSDFHRSLAIKVLLEKHKNNADMVQRFLDEARIMGQLQHPGIPPVHDMGKLDDGRPFFSMKQIKGQTLADMLRQRQDLLENVPQYISIFGQLCQTLAYAHSQGVVHRDLKPGNIMVGAFGEVQVMDWGLAKRIGQREEESQNGEANATIQISKISDSRSVLTNTGQVLGTASYMAPEQARGEIDQLDERCDVFGLGGVLCFILSGEPPFVGATINSVHDKAQQGDLEECFLRLSQCGADAELIAFAKQCLAADKENRPRNAGDVAQAVENYEAQVQQRLRQAELDNAQAQVQADEERKRARVERQKQRFAVALIFVFVVGLAGVLWLWRQSEQERLRANLAESKAQAERDATEKGLAIMAGVNRTMVSGPTTTQLMVSKPASSLLQLFRSPRQAREENRNKVTVLTQAKTQLLPLARKYSTVVSLQTNLVDIQSGLAGFQLKIGDKKAAIRELEEAYQILTTLAKTSQGNDTDAHQLGDRFALVGALFRFTEQPQKSQFAFDQAVRFHRRRFKANPSKREHRKALSVVYFYLGEMQRATGQIEEAAQTALTRQKLWPDEPDEVYDVACELARCLALTGKGKKNLSDKEQADRERYGDLAVQTLHQAVRMGLSNPQSMNTDRDLYPLHERSDYRQLLQQLRSPKR